MNKKKSPKNSKWFIIKILFENGKKVQYEEFLDENLTQIASFKKDVAFNPSTRTWYKKAISSSLMIKTKPYLFTYLEKIGLSYAKEIKNKKGIVLGIDITLDSLNNLIGKQKLLKNSEVFIYKENGEIITYKKIRTSSTKLRKNISEHYSQLKSLNKEQYRIKIDSQEYFHNKYKITNSEYLQILTPLKSIMNPYIEKYINIFLYQFFYF